MEQLTDEYLTEQGFHTEAEREVVRQLVALLEPMATKKRRGLVNRWASREAGERRFREIFGNK